MSATRGWVRVRVWVCWALASLPTLLGQNAAAGPAFNMQQADAYINSKQWNALIPYATAWTRAEPGSADAWASLGIGYGMGLHRSEEAVNNFQRALSIRPDWPECLNAMGIEYYRMQNFTGAASAFARAAALAPQKANYWNSLAAAYSEAHDRARALEALENDRRQAAPHGGWGDWYELGNGFYQMLAYPQALEAFQQALRLNPRQGAVWNNLGNAQHNLGNASEALRDYRMAASLGDPLGAKNLDELQRAIQAAAAQARSSAGGFSAAAAINGRITAYNHTWHDPADNFGPPR